MGLNLDEQAFAEVAACHANRVELADRLQGEGQHGALVIDPFGAAVVCWPPGVKVILGLGRCNRDRRGCR